MQKASSRVLSPESLLDGAALLSCALENLQGFQDLFPASLGAEAVASMPKVKLTWGSACSGTEGAFYVAEAINRSFKHLKMPLHLSHKFSCEQNKDKQRWIHTVLASGPVFEDFVFDDSGKPVFSAAKGESDQCWFENNAGDEHDSDADAEHTCIFEDIQALGQDKAKCIVHHNSEGCQVPQVDVFVCGVSCKDVSRQNARREKAKLVLTEKESRGGSAQTWNGFLAYVTAASPAMVVFENVDGLEDSVGQSESSNLDHVLATMASLGYEAQAFMTDAHEFGLPARRRRIYIIFLKKLCPKFVLRERGLPEVTSMMRSMAASCVRSAPCASKVLLDPAAPEVADFLSEVQAKQARALEREE